MNKLVLFLMLFVNKRTHCRSTCQQYLHQPKPGYHLTKQCAASKMRSLASSNETDLDSCVKLATTKNAFAFTFANLSVDNDAVSANLSFTCNVYECPEFHSFLLSTDKSVYDYYSMFSKPLPSENYTCVPGVGVFEIVTDRMNYSNAMMACEDAGGHLANIVSESRTSNLAALVSSTLVNQTVAFRKAYVGLFFENAFVTVTGEPLSCLPFRAWAPGYPKPGRLKKDCVVLTSNRYWKTESCSLKLPFICELIADGPLSPVERYCAPIRNIKRRKNCILRNHKKIEQMEQTKQQCIDNTNMDEIEAKVDNN